MPTVTRTRQSRFALSLLVALLVLGLQPRIAHAQVEVLDEPPASTSEPQEASESFDDELSLDDGGDLEMEEMSLEEDLGELDDLDLLDLDIPVVVTASRREQRITHVPAAITIVTAEDIRRSGARSVPDALRLVAGMDVADLSYSNYAVSPRGFHGFVSRQVLILVDGRQLFDAIFGGTIWGSWPLALEDIERIEVIRGPAGVTWGANAVNGVINIITKQPEEGESVTSITSGGSRGVARQYLSYSYGDEKLRMRFSTEYERSDGFKTGGTLLAPDDAYNSTKANLYLTYDINERDQVMFSAGSSYVNEGFPRSPLFTPHNPESNANFVMGRWTRTFSEDEQLQFTLYANDFHLSPGARQIDYRYQQVAAQFSHSFRPHPDHMITWGVDSRLDLVDGTGADPFQQRRPFIEAGTIGIYAQDEWNFAENWSLHLGGRVDYDSFGDFEPSGRAALQYEIDERSSVYASVSRAFQMPPPGLRFPDLPVAFGLVRIRGEDRLDPQTLTAYELGYRAQPLDGLQLAANVFWNEHADLTTLAPRTGPPGALVLFEDNRADASLFGAELEARWQVIEELELLGNYTFQRINWRGTQGIFQKDAVSPPEHKFMVGARYSPLEDLHLNAHLYFVDQVSSPNPINPFWAREIDEYYRLDLLAEYEFWEDNAAVSVGVKNLLDDNHPEGSTTFLNSAEVPRLIFAELRFTIK